MGKAGGVKKAGTNKTISVFGLIAIAGLIPIFIAIALQGILRDGIQTWLPSLVNEQVHLDESSSILSTAILPVFSMIIVLISNALYHKIKNELTALSIKNRPPFQTANTLLLFS